jgi:hypothetical protein
MKHPLQLVIILVGIVFLSCSKNEDNSIESFFSPPNWIQGEWIITSEMHVPNPNVDGFKFTNNDFIFVYDGRYASQNSFIKKANSPGVYATDQILDSKYNITMNYILVTDRYIFSKISNSEMSCSYSNVDPPNFRTINLIKI